MKPKSDNSISSSPFGSLALTKDRALTSHADVGNQKANHLGTDKLKVDRSFAHQPISKGTNMLDKQNTIEVLDYEKILTTFYKKHKPEKVSGVGKILLKYKVRIYQFSL